MTALCNLKYIKDVSPVERDPAWKSTKILKAKRNKNPAKIKLLLNSLLKTYSIKCNIPKDRARVVKNIC